MVAPSGTYDALAFPVALPKSLVTAMLPEWLHDAFVPISSSVYESLGLNAKTSDGEDTHIIVVQLGYQHGTGVGPSIMHMNFHEAKIDVPFLKHWYRKSIDSDSLPFAYKQVIIFSLRLLQVSGLVIPGSRSLLGTFGPDKTPSSFGDEPKTLDYDIKDLLHAEFSQVDGAPGAGDGWAQLKQLLEMPWFGGKTGKTAVEFHFRWQDSNSLQGRPYHVETELTPQFLGVSADTHSSVRVATTAWRFRAPYIGVEKQAATY